MYTCECEESNNISIFIRAFNKNKQFVKPYWPKTENILSGLMSYSETSKVFLYLGSVETSEPLRWTLRPLKTPLNIDKNIILTRSDLLLCCVLFIKEVWTRMKVSPNLTEFLLTVVRSNFILKARTHHSWQRAAQNQLKHDAHDTRQSKRNKTRTEKQSNLIKQWEKNKQ